MHHGQTTIPRHEDRILVDSKTYFRELYGELAAADRARAIALLPKTKWRGRVLHTIECSGDYGRGPHKMNVPESLLWNLISIHRWVCPFHCR